MRIRPKSSYPGGAPIGLRCDQKRSYPSRKRAAHAAAGVRRRYGEAVEAYHCAACSNWHVGHPPRNAPRTLP